MRFEAALPERAAVALAKDAVACARALEVRTALAAAEGGPALLGASTCSAAGVRFAPRFPLMPGLAYRATLDLRPWGGERHAAEIVAPDRRGAPTTGVLRVAPSADVVPQNLLKFYLHFDAPMRAGQARAHVRVVEAGTGRPVRAPFAEGGVELWDPERRRLTLLFDPGRIKQDLRGEAELGPPLRVRRRYRLHVGRDWKDAAGLPLRAEFSHEFRVTVADHQRPDPAQWTVDAPRAGSRDPLVVGFPESLDEGLLAHALGIELGGEALAGSAEVEAGERGWRFTPAQPWAASAHALVVDPRLEDLAGNNLRRTFDRDLLAEPLTPDMPAPARVPFTPRPAH